MRFSKKAPTTTASEIVPGDSKREGITLRNWGTVTVYISSSSSVTTSTGFPVDTGEFFISESPKDAIYGITEASTGDLRVIEV